MFVRFVPMKINSHFCSFELNDKAEVQNQWFGRTVIHSDRRFTYEEAQERIETKTGELAEEILVLDKLAKILRKIELKMEQLHLTEVK